MRENAAPADLRGSKLPSMQRRPPMDRDDNNSLFVAPTDATDQTLRARSLPAFAAPWIARCPAARRQRDPPAPQNSNTLAIFPEPFSDRAKRIAARAPGSW